jgi:hypothetical protein
MAAPKSNKGPAVKRGRKGPMGGGIVGSVAGKIKSRKPTGGPGGRVKIKGGRDPASIARNRAKSRLRKSRIKIHRPGGDAK